MTIWLIALVLMASLAGLGYRQGAIRVGVSLLGIVTGALLAVPLSGIVAKFLVICGMKEPIAAWLVSPLIVFVSFSLAFKAGAAVLHHKVEMHYKYAAGELRLALWERLNRRLGLCLGFLNATAYLILIAFVLYVPAQFAVPFATSDNDPRWLRWSAQAGQDLDSTGFIKVARSLDSIPQLDYDMIDLGALIYRNPLLAARLSRYPPFLSLAQRPEFQDLGNDKEFMETWQRVDPIMTLFQHPKIQNIWGNLGLRRQIWDMVALDRSDLRSYLQNGTSAKYDPLQILGRWEFDINATVSVLRRAKANMLSSEMQRLKRSIVASFSKTGLVALTDHQVIVRGLPPIKLSKDVTAAGDSIQGQWQGQGAKYRVTLSGAELPATVNGDRLSIKTEGMELVFSREE